MHLYETHLPVKSTEASQRFYLDVVGLEFGYRDPTRDAVFLLIGSNRRSMLGLWGPSTTRGSDFHKCHFAIAVSLPELLAAGKRLNDLGVCTRNFPGEETVEPSVIGWLPSAQIYFSDPDDHCLEYITLLDDPPDPDFIGPLSTWQKRSGIRSSASKNILVRAAPDALLTSTDMTPSRLIRWTGLAAMLGAVVWWTSWILNGFTKDGAVAVLGLSERGWRTVANAGLVSFIGGLVGIAAAHASRAGKVAFVGFLTTLLGLVAMLAGNVIEFWVASDPGGLMMLFGLLVQPVGLILLGIPILKANVLPRWGRPVPLGFGAILGLMLVVAMVRMATGIADQEKLLVAVIMTFGLGWMVLGYALWSGWSAKKGTPNQDAA